MTPQRILTRLTGRDLAALRREAGLNQTELAHAAGIGRNAVSYWETKPAVPPGQYAPSRMLKALGITVRPALSSVRSKVDLFIGRSVTTPISSPGADGDQAPAPVRTPKQAAVPLCGARTRQGRTCRLPPEPGKARCRAHGGLSTGAKTAEGRARIAEAQHRRWAVWRLARRGAPTS